MRHATATRVQMFCSTSAPTVFSPVMLHHHFNLCLQLSPLPISPSLFPCRPSLSRMRSRSRVTRRVILTSTHGHLALLISPSSQHLPLVYILLSTQAQRERDIIFSHPGRWCEGRHVAHTSIPLDRCLCTDTGAGGLESRF